MAEVEQDKSFRDSVATVDNTGKRLWVFPKKPRGKYYNARTWLSIFYLIVLFTLPFIKVNGHPLFLINVLERKFILFGQIFWPQDFFIFGLGMIVFIVFIALFTVVFGRIFCGWICPQTIFMEMVFRKIEYWIEGDMGEQKRLAKQRWNSDKIFKKVMKWIVFWAISFLIANTFLAYIIGVDELRRIVSEPVSQNLGGFTALVIFTTVFFFVYSWFREQVCTVVCPYGRMQGVLLDRNSIVVSYDHVRGEPRGKFKKNEERTIGDCIDCHQCVHVCPTGIDIRNGTQLECVNCTACMDACDNMMDAVGLSKGLIRYASESNIADKKKLRFTGRIKFYTVVMVVLLGVEAFLLMSRADVGITVLRAQGQLFQEQEAEGTFSNLYNYKFLNKTYKEKELELRPENFEGRIDIVGEGELVVPKETDISGSMFIYIDKEDIKERKTKLKIGVYENGEKITTIKTSFLGPFTAN